MMVPLITDAEREAMLDNGRRYDADEEFEQPPLVRLFTPDANATWLLTSIDPEEPDLAFGLCDLGFGFPELGSVSLGSLAELRGNPDLNVERDRHFVATKTLSEYARTARRERRIVTD